jgi:hypothetical protein
MMLESLRDGDGEGCRGLRYSQARIDGIVIPLGIQNMGRIDENRGIINTQEHGRQNPPRKD